MEIFSEAKATNMIRGVRPISSVKCSDAGCCFVTVFDLHLRQSEGKALS